MRIRDAGPVCDRLWYFGREESGIYLLAGRRHSLIISGGMSYLAPDVLDQFHRFGIDEERIDRLLILHAHFDHVGLVPLFRRRCPRIELYASARGWEILQMPKAIDTINAFSRLVADRMGISASLEGHDLEWRLEPAGYAVKEGDVMDLGGLTVHIFETPGHSSCSVSAYVPELKALFPSDGGGVPFAETIIPTGNSNFTQYQQGLQKLRACKTEILCADHYGYVTGPEAGDYIDRSIALAAEERNRVESISLGTGSVDETVRELTEEFDGQHPGYFLAPEIRAGIYRQVVRHIAGALKHGPAVEPVRGRKQADQ
jgi:glyoxylase-like metal-dependent hydrolase (beta-lactamase superfamily II)